jgi:hypothetical protein
MILTAIASILLSNGIFGMNKTWATLVVLFPALSTAISSYVSLFGFEKQAKLFKEALRNLHRAEASLYDAQQPLDDAESQVKIGAYVSEVKAISTKR